MSYDYGSIDLGLRNPFKVEGKMAIVRGVVQSVIGLYLLISAAGVVKEDVGTGWIYVGFGAFVLAAGLKVLGSGVFAIMRYFVGRSHPTSLAFNYSKSEQSTSEEESNYVAYSAKTLEEMLVGRKNSTFIEPIGFLARLVHSLLPKLLFMPYPIRNMSQHLFGSLVKTIVAIIAYIFVAFVSLSGFAGDVGQLVFPVYSVVLILFLIKTWRNTGLSIARRSEKTIESLGSNDLVKVVVLSLMLPVAIGLALSFLVDELAFTLSDLENWINNFPSLHINLYLFTVMFGAALCSSVVLFLLFKRLNIVNPRAEVSELRENWQESVHPDEIFINLDNLVMANRRYKEVPNRVYKELDPQLEEQVEGKGVFKGEMIQEIQPKVKDMELGDGFNNVRFFTLLAGNVLFVISSVLTLMLSYYVVDIYQALKITDISSVSNLLTSDDFMEYSNLFMSAIHIFLIGYIIKSFAHLLVNSAHLFFSEIQFESMLIYFKFEGTFTESKISTGAGIHDSTRSENTLVRSSITPWIIVSRIISSTFAETGADNLEHSRYVMEMHKDDVELESIRSEIISFLKDRESIASLTSERDLRNTSQIYQLNEQTRARPSVHKLGNDAEAAGYLRKEEDLNEKKEE